MNNNLDNFNLNNPQNTNPIPTPNNNLANNNQPINVIPGGIGTNNQTNNNHQFDDAFINRNNSTEPVSQPQNNFINPVNNSVIPNQTVATNVPAEEEFNPMLMGKQNKFINNNVEASNNTLNDLNVNGEYNDLPKVDYSRDPKVAENLNNIKKNTVTITSEGKVFIIIILVLLLFIFVMPTIFDFLGKLKYQ